MQQVKSFSAIIFFACLSSSSINTNNSNTANISNSKSSGEDTYYEYTITSGSKELTMIIEN